MAMSRDGLLPQFFSKTHSKYKTPYNAAIVSAIFVGLVSSIIPLTILVEIVSMGTLMAFAFVNLSVIYLRKYKPDMIRPYRSPFVPYLPALGAFLCFILMLSLPSENWWRFAIWLIIGLSIYFFYGRHHSIKKVISKSQAEKADETQKSIVDSQNSPDTELQVEINPINTSSSHELTDVKLPVQEQEQKE